MHLVPLLCACQLPLLHLGMCLLESPLVLSGWLVVCLTGVERQLSAPQVPWLRQRQPRLPRRKRDCTLALFFTTSASTSATSLCASEEEGLHTGLPLHNVNMYLGGRKSASSSEEEEQVLLLTMWVCTSEEEGQAERAPPATTRRPQ